jgi:hypothetical protein
MKSLNQYLYSSIVFGSENAAQKLRLESTSNTSKGIVEVVGTSLDLIVGSQIARFQHANSALRTYTFPDYSGTVLVSGLLTTAGDFVYASSPYTYAALHSAINGVLSSTSSGLPQWSTGSIGQFLQLTSSGVAFDNLPANIGTISDSTAGNTLPMYVAAGNDLVPLTTVNGRALLSSAFGALVWNLITAPYLQGAVGALDNGTLGYLLSSRGDGSFEWTAPNTSIIKGVK